MMIQHRLIVLILFCFAITLVGAPRLSAQSPRTVEATVPFDFWIEGSLLPAGGY